MKKKISERLMTDKQQVGQMNHYWKDLDHMASDDAKKKSMDKRFGIRNIKLDRYGNIISFDKYKRGASEDHDCDVVHPKQSHKEWEKEQKESVDWKKYDAPYGGRHGKKFDSWDEWKKVEKEHEKLEKTQNGKKQMNNILMPRSPKNRNKTYEQFIKEAKGGTAVFTFGRFNPPTIGHEKLLTVLASTATKQRGEYYVFLSHSEDTKKNPLSYEHKMMFLKLMFPTHRTKFTKSKARDALEIAAELYDKKRYSKLVMVVGSDRVIEFETILNQYNGEKKKHGFYDYKQIEVISAGERDPDAEGAGGMSASKMRVAVKDGEYETFKMGVPAGVSEKDCHNLYNAVAKGMKVNIKEGMEYNTTEIEEMNELIEEIDTLCKNSTIPIFREDQMCEFLLFKEAVEEGDLEKVKHWVEASTGLSPAQRRKMALRMKIQAKKPGFIMKRLRAMKRAASKRTIEVRARKAAIQQVVKKFFPKLKTKPKSELSYSERGKISDIVKKKAKTITMFAKKLLIKTRKKDVERRKSMAQSKN